MRVPGKAAHPVLSLRSAVVDLAPKEFTIFSPPVYKDRVVQERLGAVAAGRRTLRYSGGRDADLLWFL